MDSFFNSGMNLGSSPKILHQNGLGPSSLGAPHEPFSCSSHPEGLFLFHRMEVRFLLNGGWCLYFTGKNWFLKGQGGAGLTPYSILYCGAGWSYPSLTQPIRVSQSSDITILIKPLDLLKLALFRHTNVDVSGTEPMLAWNRLPAIASDSAPRWSLEITKCGRNSFHWAEFTLHESRDKGMREWTMGPSSGSF